MLCDSELELAVVSFFSMKLCLHLYRILSFYGPADRGNYFCIADVLNVG